MSTRDFLVEIGTEELPPLSLPELSSLRVRRKPSPTLPVRQ